jgi:arginyl-tRNA synthetase
VRIQQLKQRLRDAVTAAFPGTDAGEIHLRPSSDPKFGDYQTNAVMTLAKRRGANPRALAGEVLSRFDGTGLCSTPEVAGAGFLNFRLTTEAIAGELTDVLRGGPLFFQPAADPKSVVVDFSSPNVAKPMHVGHIRSTILGDCITRTLRLLGHRVVADNHLGDWGTQFGMLITGWKTLLDSAALARDPIAEMGRIYRIINGECDPAKSSFKPETLERARAELVKLQAGDADNLAIWREMLRLSQAQFDAIYGRLGVRFDVTLGESFYNPRLADVAAEMARLGVAQRSEGALAVFSDGATPAKEDPFLIQRDGEWRPNPFLVQKADGGFNYGTTDLATLLHRFETWAPKDIVYVTDGRQQLHFRQLFAAFRRWRPDLAAKARFHHVWFGSILGEDGKPLKTRDGDNVSLAAVLDEAEARAARIVAEKRPDLGEAERAAVARIVGLGAVKWQDLLPNRQSDYQFSWDKMLALTGNTAPYVQYQFTRARKVFRDGGETPAEVSVGELTEPAELALAKALLNYGFTLEAVAEEYRPNYLCNYLYDLASLSSRFYESCPVLKASGPRRSARLALCDLTARVLQSGLNTLGIDAPETM